MKRFFAPIIIGVSQAYAKLFPNTFKKRTWWPVFVVGGILVAVLGVGLVHAQTITSNTIFTGLSDTFAKLLLELAKLCIFLTIFFLRFFITLASYNNYIDVSVVKLGWVMVRDVANMFFIVGLLIIAFATILGFESYEWKKGVVKIILMAILINFSNLIAQLIIDVAHVFTITFLNAVAATAGGNLITLFQMDKILSIVSRAPLGDTNVAAHLSIFAASVISFLFAFLAALTIGSYLLVMIARIVVLWALIILSPLAFMLYAVPKGEDYAHEWWNEFSKHVIVAPVMVFFLWLAFATFGTGQVISEIQNDPNVIKVNSTGEEQSVSLADVSTWENMASFLLGLAFLWVGIKKTQDTGAEGSHLIGSAIDFTKNAATIATGYAAGRWIVGKGHEGGKSLVGSAAYRAPIIGGRAWKNRAYRVGSWWEERKINQDKKAIKLDEAQRKINKLKMYTKVGTKEQKEKAQRELAEITPAERTKAWFGRLGASLIETNGRKEKQLEDAKKGYEHTKEWREEAYSTSNLSNGLRKQYIIGQMKIQEVISEHKGKTKIDDIIGRLQGQFPKLSQDLQKLHLDAERAEATRKRIEAQAHEKFHHKEAHKEPEKNMFYEVSREKAITENINEEIHRSEKILDALKRAEQYQTKGDTLRAQSTIRAAYQEITEENAKKFKSLARGERGGVAQRMLKEMTQKTQALQAPNLDHDEESKLKETRAQLGRDMFTLFNYSASEGADEYNAVRDAAIVALSEQLYGGGPVDTSTKNQGKLFLELFTGKKIDTDAEFKGAEKIFEAAYKDENERNAVLSTFLNKSLFKVGAEGGVAASAGITKVPTYTDTTDPNNPKEIKEHYEFRNNFAAPPVGAAPQPQNIANLYDGWGWIRYVTTKELNDTNDMTETKKIVNQQGQLEIKVTGMLPEQKTLLKQILGKFGDEREISSGFNAKFATSTRLQNFDTPKAAAEYIELLAETLQGYVAKTKDGVGKQLMRTQYSSFITDVLEKLRTDPNFAADPEIQHVTTQIRQLEQSLH